MENKEMLQQLRHSCAHVMAEAVLQLFPQAKIAIGPAIDNGFYYDFELPRPLTPEDLLIIEEKMRKLIAADTEFERKVVSKSEAKKLFSQQPFKLELIEELDANQEITVYSQGAFTDLCRGPHLERSGQLNPSAFKLLNIASAYWRSDEKRESLQRIYGTAWENKKQLDDYLAKLAEIEKRDHRRLGKDLQLYSIHEEAGPGFIYWHPKGGRIRLAIEDFWRSEHRKNGYEILFTPHVGRSWLWETSGHLGFYKESMYPPMQMDNQEYYVKPMNCPFHIMIYQTALRSYRDLPLRWAELGTVYRYERSGVLHGLLRVRGFTQDDAHIICTPEQIENEILEVLRFSLRMWKCFGFSDIKAYLATRPAGSIGENSRWEQAQACLKNAITCEGLPYEIDEGGGAFYGPKIDLKIQDALGREWQMTTIQFDFNMPERFQMTYVDADGKQKRPYMVHRALLGSLERFFGVLIEHYAGAFPVWIAPVQAMVIPVAPAFETYAHQCAQILQAEGLRVDKDLSDQRMNAKIRDAQNQKIPYMLIVGQKEMEAQSVSIRTRTGEQLPVMSIKDFTAFIKQKIDEKAVL